MSHEEEIRMLDDGQPEGARKTPRRERTLAQLLDDLICEAVGNVDSGADEFGAGVKGLLAEILRRFGPERTGDAAQVLADVKTIRELVALYMPQFGEPPVRETSFAALDRIAEYIREGQK